MILDFAIRFEIKRTELAAVFRSRHPSTYFDLVTEVIKILHTDDYSSPDPTRVHQINSGDYHGALVFVIAATGRQPSEYWYVKVDCGLVSGCDTLREISNGSYDPPTDEQVHKYMALAFRVAQGLRSM
jgi:hypothetical protein